MINISWKKILNTITWEKSNEFSIDNCVYLAHFFKIYKFVFVSGELSHYNNNQ